MDWRPYISVSEDVAGGRPVVRGTRLRVDLLLGLLADGWTTAALIESYPALSPDAVRATIAFAADLVADHSHVITRQGTA